MGYLVNEKESNDGILFSYYESPALRRAASVSRISRMESVYLRNSYTDDQTKFHHVLRVIIVIFIFCDVYLENVIFSELDLLTWFLRRKQLFELIGRKCFFGAGRF